MNSHERQIWSCIIKKYPETNLSQKQIYAYWAHINQDRWRLDDEQLKSAQKVLETYQGTKIQQIPIRHEEGMTTIAFAFRRVIDKFGPTVTEVAMDSTCTKAFNKYSWLGITHSSPVDREDQRIGF
jgi:hypothetical protein